MESTVGNRGLLGTGVSKGFEGAGMEKKHFFATEIPFLGVVILGLMVKCTPERGHNALFFIPLEVIIML